MKKWILSSCMGAALALSMGAVAMAQHVPPGAYCNYYDDFGGSHDVCVNCVAAGQNGGGDVAVCICKENDNLGFENQGQCIKYLHSEGLP